MRVLYSTLFGKSSAGAHHSNVDTVTLHPEKWRESGEIVCIHGLTRVCQWSEISGF